LDKIVLDSGVITVKAINKKTQAKMFKDLKVGDQIYFSVPIEAAGRNRSTYATYITVINMKTLEKTESSFNQLPTILKAFEFEQG
jgi:membrane protease subunit (stomatin/prohibitin family)